jgi:predicted RNase H-like HicB family nuclease
MEVLAIPGCARQGEAAEELLATLYEAIESKQQVIWL